MAYAIYKIDPTAPDGRRRIDGGAPGPQAEPGKGASVAIVAGENVATGDALYLELAGAEGTPMRAYHADSSLRSRSTECVLLGLAEAGATAGATLTVQRGGVVSGLSGLGVAEVAQIKTGTQPS